MEWFALILPLIIAFILMKFFSKDMVWWELLIPIATCAIFIGVFKFTVKTVMVSDNEFWGSIVTSARYYEYWESYVHATCTRQVACGTNSKGETEYCTETYDCSYCDRNSAYWEAYDDAGNSFRISQEYYNTLRKKWNATPSFIELNRRITNYSSCGDDGDAYQIGWDNRVESSEAAVTVHSYTNKVQASHSSFKLPYISEEQAQIEGLYNYPERYYPYKQQVVLGLNEIYGASQTNYIENKFQYFNGKYGAINKVKLFVLLFYDKPLNTSFRQEAYWDGGNQNELVVCIGIDKKTRALTWVRAFSWTDRKRVLVDCREDIMNLKTFDPHKTYDVIEKSVNTNVMYKDFQKDFDYLTVDLPTWAMVTLYIVTLLITLGAAYWCIINPFDNESPQGGYRPRSWNEPAEDKFDNLKKFFKK